jgi:hypothetical protein
MEVTKTPLQFMFNNARNISHTSGIWGQNTTRKLRSTIDAPRPRLQVVCAEHANLKKSVCLLSHSGARDNSFIETKILTNMIQYI